MARLIEPDSLDWETYERQTEAAAKVRPASAYLHDLEQQFAPRDKHSRRPRMSSTKLRNCIEFRPGEVSVWAGYNGHRKSLVTSQTMLDLCSQGERTLAMSFEMLPAVTLARMARQAWATSTPNGRQRSAFLRWSDDRLWILDHMGKFSPSKSLAVMRYFADELQGCHVFLDSMMMVCESEESFDEQKALIADLVRVAQETAMHVHLIAHCRKPSDDESKPPSKYHVRGSSSITDLSHNVLTVWANKAKKLEIEAKGAQIDEKWLEQPDAVLSVEKQRNGAYEGKLKLWFDEASFRFTDERTTPIEPYVIEEAFS